LVIGGAEVDQTTPRPAQSGILIVGAGLAGLTLALALARKGVKTTVIEKQNEIAPSKWAILLYPIGMKIFQDLGVLEGIMSLAMPLKDSQVDTLGGRTLATIHAGLLLKDFDYSLGIGPSEIRMVLRKHVLESGVELLEGAKYLGAVKDAGSGRVIGARCTQDGQEFVFSSRLLVGADGYKSRVREDFAVKTESREYPPVVGIMVRHRHGLDRFHMVLASGYQVVMLPISLDLMQVGLTERRITEEELIKRGEGYVKKRISDAVPSLSQVLDASGANFRDESMLVIRPQEIWAKSYAVDGGVLVGDAAHSFHPGTGQGAQQSFLDAQILAPVIERGVNTGDFSRESLREYEKPRQTLMGFWKGNSQRLISMETADGRFGIWMRNRYMRKVDKITERREVQEVLLGLRPPSRMELLQLTLSLLF